MDNMFEIVVIFLNFVLGGIMTMIGYAAKRIDAKIEKTSDDLASFKTYVAVMHPTHETIEKRFDKLEEKMDKMVEKMDRVLSK